MKMYDAFRYCLRCGHKFQKDPHAFTCPNCGLHFYLNPKAAAGVILSNTKDEILLVKRARNPGKGLWTIPGGYTDLNETLENCAKREAKEEVGVKLAKINYLGSVTHPYIYDDIEYFIIAAIFGAKLPKDTKIVASDDAEDYQYFAKNDLPLGKFAFPEIGDWLTARL